MRSKQNPFRITRLFTLITILFFILIATDLIPYLRGPAPHPQEWRWIYQYSNNLNKIWAPLVAGLSIILFSYAVKRKDATFISKKKYLLISFIVIIGFLFQVSLLYYSRSGIRVLFSRIANPDITSHFSASVQIRPKDIPYFLKNFTSLIKDLPLHARSHPPGTILMFVGLNTLFENIPIPNSVLSLKPQRADVLDIWNQLQPAQKMTAVSSGFIIILLSQLAVIPLYLIATTLSNPKAAIYASLLYISIPALSSFPPFPDLFLPLFGLTAFYFLIKYFKNFKPSYLFITGLTLSTGLFFSLSLSPIILMSSLYYLFKSSMLDKPKRLGLKRHIKNAVSAFLGFISFPLLMYILFGFNIFDVVISIIKANPVGFRSYPVWLFFNIYDFFLFIGVIISLLFLWILSNKKVKITADKNYGALILALISSIIIFDLSGSTRGETGRIWLPLMPYVVIIVAGFIYKLFPKIRYLSSLIIILQIVQGILFQTFWVTLW